MKEYFTLTRSTEASYPGGGRGVIVIEANGHGDTSSNPGQD